MKRYSAILFLFLFFLYHAGYISVFWLASNQIEAYWERNLTYDKEDLQKISIPMTLPYWADQESYSSSKGSFQMNGKTYRAVLQKYANGQMHLMVVEDQLTTHLHQSIKDWVKSTTNSTSEKNNKVNYLQGITKDYQPTEAFKYLSGIVLDDTKSPSSSYFFSIRSFISEIDTPPPQI